MSRDLFTEFNPGISLPETDAVEFYQPARDDNSMGEAVGPFSTNYFSADGWQRCSGPSLRGHIVNAHLQAITFAGIGLPLYDVEVAQVRSIGLGWVVKKAVQKMGLSDGELQEHIEENQVGRVMSPDGFRLALVKTIKLIDALGMASVPWGKVDRVYSGASAVTLDIAREGDMSFYDTHQGRLALLEAEARSVALARYGAISNGSIHPELDAELARDDIKVKLD